MVGPNARTDGRTIYSHSGPLDYETASGHSGSSASIWAGPRIEIGVGIGAARQRAGDHVARNPRIGGAVAAIAERRPAVRHAWDLPDRRQTGVARTERTGPGELDRRVRAADQL